MFVTDHLPTRIHPNVKLFFLQRTEKSHVPIPDIQCGGHQLIRLLQAELALEIRLRAFVQIERDTRAIAAYVFAETGNKILGPLLCLPPRNLEIDRYFRERLKIEFVCKQHADDS